jgi:hypothetical protein
MMGAKERRATMTSMTHSVPATASRGASHRSGTDPAFLIAAALFLAVVIANAAFIALAARSIPDIGSLYITVT